MDPGERHPCQGLPLPPIFLPQSPAPHTHKCLRSALQARLEAFLPVAALVYGATCLWWQ
jgi:hypothetical protein